MSERYYIPFEVFKLFNAIRLTFQGKFDYHKYGLHRKNWTESNFASNKSPHLYAWVAQKYPADIIRDIFVSNYLEDQQLWIHDFLDPKVKEVYTLWKGRQDSLEYLFEEDIKKIMKYVDDSPSLIQDELDGPEIVEAPLAKVDRILLGRNSIIPSWYFQKKVMPETLVILDLIFKKMNSDFFRNFYIQGRKLQEHNVFWFKKAKMLESAYEPFFKDIDIDLYGKIVKKALLTI